MLYKSLPSDRAKGLHKGFPAHRHAKGAGKKVA